MRGTRLAGSLAIPQPVNGVVLVVVAELEHARDPGRLRLADYLYQERLATVIVALCGEDEEPPGLEVLAGRVATGLRWIASEPRLRGLPLGVLADGDAVTPALVALSRDPERVHAFVACGGAPDDAAGALADVAAPTLLVVGGYDTGGLLAARVALAGLPDHAELAVIDDTADPLGGPDGLAAFARLAGRWLLDHLAPAVS